MTEKKQPTGDYPIGYARPPEESKYPKGTSGNPKGRPSSKISNATLVAGILDEPIKAKIGGKVREIQPFEAGLRVMVEKALKKDLRAIKKFVKVCEEYGVITPPPAITGGGVVVAPRGVNFREWFESVTEEIPVDEE